MAKKRPQRQQHVPKRVSKRQRRIKIIVYLMVIAMVLSIFTYGLAFL